jgi:hypothetical protein
MKTLDKLCMKYTFLFICIFINFYNIKAQSITPATPVVCPGVAIDYSWTSLGGGCTYNWTVTNGKFQTINGFQTQLVGQNLHISCISLINKAQLQNKL